MNIGIQFKKLALIFVVFGMILSGCSFGDDGDKNVSINTIDNEVKNITSETIKVKEEPNITLADTKMTLRKYFDDYIIILKKF